MNNTFLMGIVNCPGEHFNRCRCLTRRLRKTRTEPCQTSSFHEFHREVWQALMFPNIVQLDNVRMLQPSDGSRFSAKPQYMLGPCAENHLQSDRLPVG